MVYNAHRKYGPYLGSNREFVNHIVIMVPDLPEARTRPFGWVVKVDDGYEIGFVLESPVRLSWPDGSPVRQNPIYLLDDAVKHLEKLYGGTRVEKYRNPAYPGNEAEIRAWVMPQSLKNLAPKDDGNRYRSYGGRSKTRETSMQNLDIANGAKQERVEERYEQLTDMRESGMTFREIAERTGKTENAVKLALRRAKRRPTAAEIRAEVEAEFAAKLAQERAQERQQTRDEMEAHAGRFSGQPWTEAEHAEVVDNWRWAIEHGYILSTERNAKGELNFDYREPETAGLG